MIEALRPSTLGEILDRTASMYRSRFLVYLGIAALPVGVVLACAVAAILFFAWVGSEGQSVGPVAVGVLSILFFAAGMLILLPLSIAAVGLGEGAVNHAAVAAFQNQKITIRDAYKVAWKRGWHYIWLFIIEGLIVFAAPAVVWTVLFLIFAVSEGLMGKASNEAGAAMGALVLLLLLAFAVYAVWMLLMLCLSFPACVVENASAWAAVRRSISLSRGARGRILVLYVLGIALRWGLSTVLTIPAILIVTLVPGLDTPQHAQIIGTILLMVIYGGSFAVRAFTKPIYAIAETLFYYDQRIRKEGFDIEWMMQQAGMVDVPTAAPQAAPWMAPVLRRAPEPAAESQLGNVALYPAAGAVEPSPTDNGGNLPPAPKPLQPAPGESA